MGTRSRARENDHIHRREAYAKSKQEQTYSVVAVTDRLPRLDKGREDQGSRGNPEPGNLRAGSRLGVARQRRPFPEVALPAEHGFRRLDEQAFGQYVGSQSKHHEASQFA